MKKIFLLTVCCLLQFLMRAQENQEPINNSFISFTIPEKDLLPESIAYDTTNKEFYIGSTRKGKIVKISKDGNFSDFISPNQEGLWMVIGIKIDSKSRILWVCSSGGDNLLNYNLKDENEGRPAGIFKFHLDTGKLINKYLFNKPGEVHFFNDLVLDSNGNVYITHMFQDHAIYTIQKEKDKLEVFLKSPNLKYPNGITISNDNRFLFIPHSEGIARIEITSKKYIEIANPKNLKISHRESIDGLYFYKNSLIAVQPDINSVQRFILNDNMDSIIDTKILEVNHPMMDNPTTGVLVDDKLYFIANSQFGSFNKDGSLFSLEKLYEPTILKIKIND